jgi:hypothetical protein
MATSRRVGHGADAPVLVSVAGRFMRFDAVPVASCRE